MSNVLCINPTKFVDLRTGKESFGLVAYDTYGSFYADGEESIPDDDLEVLKFALELSNEDLNKMLDFVQENSCGVFIGRVYYDWTKIAALFQERSK